MLPPFGFVIMDQWLFTPLGYDEPFSKDHIPEEYLEFIIDIELHASRI